ncbi:hypothetical protein CDL15_Pgr009271 [Punica granatum]|uniref:Uncharacterized protein n=1 Tax=Punica granatum TaxID=22663 RepID=A0A218VVU8_PUNGR|nr:hypothetical protein CDL15_Pgr009271 [Punica granatum]
MYPIWDSKNPSWYQNDQQHPRAHFRSLLLKSGHSRTFVDAFLTGLLDICRRLPNGAPETPDPRTNKRNPETGLQTHPRVTKTRGQVSDYLSELILASRVHLDSEKEPFSAQKHCRSPFEQIISARNLRRLIPVTSRPWKIDPDHIAQSV